MSYIPDFTHDLQVLGVFDPGVANQERVVLRPNRQLSLAGHAIALGIESPDGGAFPLYDHVFWFPRMIVEPPAWIFVYTGRGVFRQAQMPSGDPALSFHWNRDITLFNVPNAVAIVFEADHPQFVKQWNPVRQLPRGEQQ